MESSVSLKRQWGESDESSSGSEASAFYTAAAGSPSIKRTKHHTCQDNCMMLDSQQQQQQQGTSSWVLDYHTGSGQLQTTNSSTLQWAQLPGSDVQQQTDQMVCDSQQHKGLVRTASAPELLKLAQADSAAWQALHAGGSNMQAAFLSHQDHWMVS